MSQPAYLVIADAIRRDIIERRLIEGDRLPTVRDIAKSHNVPVGTVTRALDQLRMEGLIVSRHGRGLYVRTFSRIRRSSPKRLARAHWGTGQAIQDHDTGQRLRVVDVIVSEVPSPATVADALGVPAGAAVLIRSRKFAVEDRVVQTAVSYLPLDLVAKAPSIAYTGPGPGGIYARLTEAGFEPVSFVERAVCRMPTPVEVTDLGLPTGTPVVAVTRFAFTAADRCVEVNMMLLDASAYELEYVFGSGDPP